MATNIVIVGAGYGGILTAKNLEKKFRKNANVNITIIDKNPYHTMLTELHEVAAGRVDEDSIKISLAKVFAGRRVNVKLDTVKNVDFAGKKVEGTVATYKYDYLVMAAGSKPTFFGVPGAEEFSYKLWSFDDAVLLRERIQTCFRLAATETDLNEKKKLLTFYVVGAGFTGIEMIGELAEYAPILCEKYEIPREMVKLVVADVLPRLMPILPEKLTNKVEKRLQKMGVEVRMGSGVSGIGADFIELKKGDKVTKHVAGTVVWAAGIESADITNECAKTLQSAGRGRIKLDDNLRSLDDKSVYVVGDNMLYTPKNAEMPVPQMVENCEHSSACVAHNIYVDITGKGEKEVYNPSFHGVMVCVGGRYGTARVGLPNMMFNLPSFFAMLSKHFINIIYFIQVLGWNKIFSYIKHEFFVVRNKRSFLGGHFSNRTPSFLLVPLRLWLGGVWLFEGIMKVTEGWLSEPKLSAFFGGANAWYNSVLGIVTSDAAAAATGAAADAASSATGAAGEAAASAGVALMNWRILGLFDTIFVSGKEIAHSTLSDYAFKLNIPAMNWFLDKFVMPNDGVQLAMQIFIVVAEIAIGLSLLGGLFTFASSALSLILQFMFITTTGLYLNTFWMVFAGIAVLIGGGSIFGLDYYVIPWLKARWKKVGFVRRLYIYND